MTPKEWVFGAGRGRPLEGLTRDDERTSRTSLLRALPRPRSSARDRPLARRVHGDKGGERRGERRRLRYPEGNGVRVCPTRGDVAFRGSRIDRQWKHRGAGDADRGSVVAFAGACRDARADPGSAIRSTNVISDCCPNNAALPDDSSPDDACAHGDHPNGAAAAHHHAPAPALTPRAASPAVSQKDPHFLEHRSTYLDERWVAQHLRLERIIRVIRFLAAALVLAFGSRLANIGEPFVIVLGVFLAGYGVIVIVLWARARTAEAVEWASHLTLAADVSVVGFALLVFARDPGWTVYASGFLVIASAGLRFRSGAVLAALSLSLTYAVVTAFRVVELGIPIGIAQFGVQFGTYLLAGAVLNQILPEMEAMRSRELDLYEPVLMAQEASGEAVLITEDGRPVFFNRAFVLLSGHPAAELGRVAVAELIVADPRALTDAEPRLPFDGEVLTRDGGRTSVEISYRRSLKNGRERVVWILRDAAKRGQGGDAPMHDSLTGLPNGALFKKRATDALSWAQRKERQVSLLLVGLDEVGGTDRTLGRAARDEILIDIGTRLSRALRESDLAARTGTAQFVALLIDTPAAGAEQVARTLLRIISAPVAIDGEPVSMGASIGISVYPTHAKEIDGLLGRADAAMSAARQDRMGWRTAEER